MTTPAENSPPLSSTSLKSQNGAITAFHIASSLNVEHRIFIALDSKRLSVLNSQGGNEKNVDVDGERAIWAITSWEDVWFATGGAEGEISVWNLKTL